MNVVGLGNVRPLQLVPSCPRPGDARFGRRLLQTQRRLNVLRLLCRREILLRNELPSRNRTVEIIFEAIVDHRYPL